MKRASIVRDGAVLVFHFTADGFLYRMVRNLVGALVKVGKGKITVEEFGEILRSCKRSAAPETAPACGLYLMHVVYKATDPASASNKIALPASAEIQ
jgi:tRNA pseudouridine38-40 synthase